MFLRLDSFVEVRWVESGSSDERVRHDCIVGLQCLRQRLTANPSGHRVLLLVDELEARVGARSGLGPIWAHKNSQRYDFAQSI